MTLLSVLIPTRNEAAWLPHCVSVLSAGLREFEPEAEIIVCDASDDEGAESASRWVDHVVRTSRPNRSKQLNAGAQIARGEFLLFLHADSLLRPDALGELLALCQLRREDPNFVGGWFEIDLIARTDSLFDRATLRAIAEGINFRTRLFHTATADQGIFIRSNLFEHIGGFQDIPLFEGNALIRQMRTRGETAIVGASRLEISARRWESAGPLHMTLKMYALRAGFLAGIPPSTLARFWRSRDKK